MSDLYDRLMGRLEPEKPERYSLLDDIREHYSPRVRAAIDRAEAKRPKSVKEGLSLIGNTLPFRSLKGALSGAAGVARAGGGILSALGFPDTGESIQSVSEELIGNLQGRGGFGERVASDPVGAVVSSASSGAAQIVPAILAGPAAAGTYFGAQAFGNNMAELDDNENLSQLERVGGAAAATVPQVALERSGLAAILGARSGSPLPVNMAVGAIAEGVTEGLESAPRNLAEALLDGEASVIDAARQTIQEFPEAAAEGALSGSALSMAGTTSDLGTAMRREFTSGGRYAPFRQDQERVAKIVFGREAQIIAGKMEVEFVKKDFEAALKELPKEQRLDVSREANRYLEAGPIEREEIDLPDSVRSATDQMRSLLDRESSAIAERLEGAMPDDDRTDAWRESVAADYETEAAQVRTLPETIRENMGSWLRRSYAAKLDPEGWRDRVVNGDRREVFDRAVDFLIEAPREKGGMLESMRGLDEEAAVQAAQNYAYDLLDADPAAFLTLGDGDNVRIATKFLEGRKDMPGPIRELLGEVDDPVVRFMDAHARQRSFNATWDATNELLDMGAGTWFFESRESAPLEASVPIRLGSRVTAGGRPEAREVYTTPEIAEAIEGMRVELDGMSQAWTRMNGTVKQALTVWNPQTHLRNISFWSLASMTLGTSPMTTLRAARAIVNKESDAFKIMGFDSKEAMRASQIRAAELGVMGESTHFSDLELRPESDDVNWMKYAAKDPADNSIWSKAFGAGKKGLDWLGKKYGEEDDVPRWVLWRQQQKMLARLYPEWSQAKVEEVAADRVRRYTPTWSMAAPITKRLRQIPFVFPFPTFAAESLRTSITLASDSVRGLKSPDPRVRQVSARQLAGSFMAAYGAKAIVEAGLKLTGVVVDEEDDEALEQIAQRPYEKYQDWTTLRMGDGNFITLDYGYISPWEGLLFQPARAGLQSLAQGDGVGPDVSLADAASILSGAGMQALEGLGGGPEPLFDFAFSAVTGRRMDGTRIVEQEAPAGEKLQARVEQGLRLLPTRNLTRFGQSLSGQPASSGVVYNPKVELFNQISPIRAFVRNPRQEFPLKFSKAADRMASLNRVWREGAIDLSTDDAFGGDVLKAIDHAETQWRESVYPEMLQLVKGAQRLEVPIDIILDSMESVDRTTKMMLLAGIEQAPPLVSPEDRVRAMLRREKLKRRALPFLQ